MRAVGEIIQVLLWILVALLWVRFVVEWVLVFARSWVPRGAVLVVLEVLLTATDPPVRLLRAVLPRPRLGGARLDLSLLVALLLAYGLLRLNGWLLLG